MATRVEAVRRSGRWCPREEAVALLGAVEADDRPRLLLAGAPEPSTRWLPSSRCSSSSRKVTIMGGGSQPSSTMSARSSTSSRHSSSSTGDEHRVVGRAGEAVELVERQPHRTDPGARRVGEAVGAARRCRCRGWRGTRPPSRRARRARRLGGRLSTVNVVAHPPCLPGQLRLQPDAWSAFSHRAARPRRWPVSLKEWSVQRSRTGSCSHSVSPVLVGRSCVVPPGGAARGGPASRR